MVSYYSSVITKNNKNADFFLELGNMITDKMKDCVFNEAKNNYNREDDNIGELHDLWKDSVRKKEDLIIELLAIILGKGNKRNVIIPNRLSVSNGKFYPFRITAYSLNLTGLKKELTEFAGQLPSDTLADVEYLLTQSLDGEGNSQFVTELKFDKTHNYYETDAKEGTLISFDRISLVNNKDEVNFSLGEGEKEQISDLFNYNQLKKKFSKEFEQLKAQHILRFLQQIKNNDQICKDLQEKYAEHLSFKRLTESAK